MEVDLSELFNWLVNFDVLMEIIYGVLLDFVGFDVWSIEELMLIKEMGWVFFLEFMFFLSIKDFLRSNFLVEMEISIEFMDFLIFSVVVLVVQLEVVGSVVMEVSFDGEEDVESIDKVIEIVMNGGMKEMFSFIVDVKIEIVVFKSEEGKLFIF